MIGTIAAKKKMGAKKAVEQVMNAIFFVCGILSILCVAVITIYMISSGAPAITKIGLKEFLLGTTWAPTAADPRFGILPMICLLYTSAMSSQASNGLFYKPLANAMRLFYAIGTGKHPAQTNFKKSIHRYCQPGIRSPWCWRP